MKTGELPKVSVVVLNWNGMEHLEACLSSLGNLRYPNYEVLLVDNGSTDGSVDFVESRFPWVKVVRNEINYYYAEGNNIGIRHADGEYVAILNNDTEVNPNWLIELVKTAEGGKTICTSKVMMYDRRNVINTCGNYVHFLGFSFCRGLNEEDTGQYDEFQEIASASGCSMLVSRSLLNDVGLFDKDFTPFYLEEEDLCWRAILAGYKCAYVPRSIVYHKYRLKMTPIKFYSLEKNRLQLILKNYRFRTIILLLPALLFTELLLIGFALLRGYRFMIQKINANVWVMRNLKKIFIKRKKVQSTRKTGDKQVLKLFVPLIDFETPLLKRAINPWFRSYLNIVYTLAG